MISQQLKSDAYIKFLPSSLKIDGDYICAAYASCAGKEWKLSFFVVIRTLAIGKWKSLY